jgi:hypothetical protein
VQLEPSSWVPFLYLGHYYYQLPDLEKARKCYQVNETRMIFEPKNLLLQLFQEFFVLNSFRSQVQIKGTGIPACKFGKIFLLFKTASTRF